MQGRLTREYSAYFKEGGRRGRGRPASEATGGFCQQALICVAAVVLIAPAGPAAAQLPSDGGYDGAATRPPAPDAREGVPAPASTTSLQEDAGAGIPAVDLRGVGLRGAEDATEPEPTEQVGPAPPSPDTVAPPGGEAPPPDGGAPLSHGRASPHDARTAVPASERPDQPEPNGGVARDEPNGNNLDELLGLMREMVQLMREMAFVPASESRGNTLHMLAFALLALVFASLTRRVRERLPVSGFVPRALAVMQVLLRIGAALLLLAIIARLVPGPAIALLVLAAAAALGWSARDVLPDVVAGLVLIFERRLRRGQWLSAEGFAGTLETVGLRATWLRDGSGNRVAVPNRQLLSAPIVSAAGAGAEHETTVRIDSPLPAGRVRQALRDAVLLSPWVPPGAAPTVLRDPDQPVLWHVRSRLLEARFGDRFEGELHERVQEILEVGDTG